MIASSILWRIEWCYKYKFVFCQSEKATDIIYRGFSLLISVSLNFSNPYEVKELKILFKIIFIIYLLLPDWGMGLILAIEIQR